MKKTVIALGLSAILAACGGGDGGGPLVAAPGGGQVMAAPVTTASTVTALSAGLTTIAANANEESFNVTADIGDSWRITLNSATGAYAVKVLATQFGLVDEFGTSSRTVSGDFVTYTESGKLSLVVDTRTKSISGNVKLGNISTTVAGTGYTANDLAKLAGIYTYFGSQRDAVTGSNAEFLAGQILVAASGSTGVICDGGTVNSAGDCSKIGTSVPNKEALALTKNTVTGLIDLKIRGVGFGSLQVHAGDRGPVLLVDRFGPNLSGIGNTQRIGALYATKLTKLAGSEFDGSYTCNSQGKLITSVVANGTSLKVTKLGSVTNEQLSYNKIVVGNTLIDFDGTLVTKLASAPASEGANILPLSSSVAIVKGDNRTYVCYQSAATTSPATVVPPVTPVTPIPPVTQIPPVTRATFLDKYVGVWTTACLTSDGTTESGRYITSISKKSDSVLTAALTATRFAGKNCTGAVLPNIFPGGIADITYENTVNLVDRFSNNGGSGKTTLTINGSVLNLGNDLNLDGYGYPLIDYSISFFKN